MKIPGRFHGREQEVRRKKINFLGRTARNLNPAILEIPFRLEQISRRRSAGGEFRARMRVRRKCVRRCSSARYEFSGRICEVRAGRFFLPLLRHPRALRLLYTAPFNPDLHFTGQQRQVDPAEDCRGRYIRSFKDLRVGTRRPAVPPPPPSPSPQCHQGLRHADHVCVYRTTKKG